MEYINDCRGCGRAKYSSSKYINPARRKRLESTLCMSCNQSGERNSRYGKTNSEEHRKRLSAANKGKTPWNKGKQIPDEMKIKISAGIRSSEKVRQNRDTIGYKISLGKLGLAKDIDIDDYKQQITEKRKYYQLVWKITNRQPLHLLENIEKRGKAKKGTDNYQLDHIISISDGFSKGISAEDIGHISNLRMIPWRENIKRYYKNIKVNKNV